MQAELIKNADASALDCPEEAFLIAINTLNTLKECGRGGIIG